jgi:hypothetical protein
VSPAKTAPHDGPVNTSHSELAPQSLSGGSH